jgi:hypothetical protein
MKGKTRDEENKKHSIMKVFIMILMPEPAFFSQVSGYIKQGKAL